MATSEDNFRVEVWDREGGSLLEVVNRCSDFFVSNAAYRQAVRRRPGRLLVHVNNGHVMERLISPGAAETDEKAIADGSTHAGIDPKMSDLREWHRLRAYCESCTHNAPLTIGTIERHFGKDATLNTIERKLTCTKCKRGRVRLEVFGASRG